MACPAVPTSIEALASVHWLLSPSCFGDTPISLRGHLSSRCDDEEPSADAEPVWLGGHCWRFTAGKDDAAGIWVHFRDGVPETPNEVSLVGHFDDPDSLSCVPATADGLSVEEAVRLCRSGFVVDDWQYTE